MNLHVEDLLGNYHKLIMDPVHGGIPLQKHEVAIVDHPLFQRLRFICQNDILSLVFPGATHSRFLHSVGAMHVAGRMFMALVENCLKQGNSNSGIATETLEAISYMHRLVRIACLLHDSGHSSFSHQFSRTPVIHDLLKTSGRYDQLWNNIDPSFKHSTQTEELEHEHYSVRVAYEILSHAPDDPALPEIADILSLMETSSIPFSAEFDRHAHALWVLIGEARGLDKQPENYVSGLHNLLSHIVSGELDADRADYMLRDGFHSSVTIGGFNLDHLLSNLHFGVCSQTSWMGLAISQKGLGSLEDFVYSRHQMYRQVYAHKTAQGFDWLLRAAIEEVMDGDSRLSFIDTCLSDIHTFKYLTDNYFWEAFRQFSIQQPRSYSRCILDRIKMPFLASRTNLSDSEKATYTDFLAQENHIPVSAIVSSTFTARFTRIQENFDDIKVLIRDPQRNSETFKRVSQVSQFFDKFSDDRITHFYIDPVRTMQ